MIRLLSEILDSMILPRQHRWPVEACRLAKASDSAEVLTSNTACAVQTCRPGLWYIYLMPLIASMDAQQLSNGKQGLYCRCRLQLSLQGACQACAMPNTKPTCICELAAELQLQAFQLPQPGHMGCSHISHPLVALLVSALAAQWLLHSQHAEQSRRRVTPTDLVQQTELGSTQSRSGKAHA